MSQMKISPETVDWECATCGRALELSKVHVAYLESRFTVELLRCPDCGLVYIPEELANGKMAEVERILEDK
ncbi:hypothetical protein DENIS_0372 [Desulfonema ishimotonii]|uniref:DUF7479 domain-containing protein n=1 Tax=Desulfonema ishimotonii TaxID=45657 RepID=A0A401FR47_9BACT|nr:CLJU_RS11820 family redox protein [Desulfonema ishimotonii]GBC59433.1 hypothetical protein DENIS_0372 [Desulfonema ishimotonii]